MSDAIPPPRQPTTVALEAPPPWAIALSQKVADGFTELRADIGLVTNDLNVVKGSVQNLQEWRGLVDDKLKTNSVRAREPSQHDVELKNELKAEKEAREALATKLDGLDKKTDVQTVMLTEAKAFLKDPRVIGVLVVIYTILSKWAEKHGYL